MQYPDLLFPGKTQKETAQVGPPKNIRIRETISSVNPISWWKTVNEIAAINPDFVVVRFWLPFMGPCLGTICKWIQSKLNIPVIAILDNVIPHEKRLGDRILTQYFLNQCSSYIVMSSSVMEDLNQFNTTKPRKLLYHPVYNHFGERVEKAFARKQLNLAPTDKIILFFGIVRKYKGLSLLLNAIAQMENKTQLKVVVAGEFYEDQQPYLQQIEDLGLTDNVIIHAGFVDKNLVKHYFSAADIVAQPYLSATQSGVTQIAYHFNTPMLVTNVGGLPEMVPHNKVGYVAEVNPASVAKHLTAFFQQKKASEFEENITEEKKRFSWRFFANEIQKIAQNKQS